MSNLRRIIPAVEIILRLAIPDFQLSQNGRYVIAFRERMIVFTKRCETTSPAGVISAMTENANRSSPPTNEHKFSVSSFGSMSNRRSTR